jgi:hypothetical protein
LHDSLPTTRLRNEPLDAELRIDGTKLTLTPENDLIGTESDQSGGAIRPERNENAPRVAGLTQRCHYSPGHVDRAASAVNEEVEGRHVIHGAEVLVHRSNCVVADLRSCWSTVACDVDKNSAAADFLDPPDQ